MSRCEFCSIISGEAPAEVLYRNEHAIAILDIRPIHRGHVLVIPLRHAENFLDVPAGDCAGLFGALRVVTRGLVDALQPPGFNVFSNNGAAAGQSVFHFHFHVTPRYHDDNIRFVLELQSYKPNEMPEYGRRIREAIASPPHRRTGHTMKENL
jgi:histidine triad (HIT) family protein